MKYLSDKGVVHRDLALRNLLLCPRTQDNACKYEVKVADFGISKMEHLTTFHLLPIPVRWSAPEVIAKRYFSTKSDVWSFGVVLWEMFTRGCIPYYEKEEGDVSAFVTKGGRLERPEQCSDDVWKIMQNCWEKNANDRSD